MQTSEIFCFALLLLFAGSYGGIIIAHPPPTSPLYPCGPGTGDIQFVPRFDDTYLKFRTMCRYRVYQHGFKNAYIGTNGYVTYGAGMSTYVPQSLSWPNMRTIAPLWSDNYLPVNNPGSDIWYRESKVKRDLRKAKNDVRDNFGKCGEDFKPKCLLIVSWKNLESWCSSFNNWYGKRDTDEPSKEGAVPKNATGRAHTPTNTFQLVLATDDKKNTFAMFNYDKLEWDFCWDYNRAGFGSGVNHSPANSCAELPSGVGLAGNSNVGKIGRWMYKVDGKQVKDPKCNVEPQC